MPIDYSKYPKNWKTEIRPAILERAKNRCENCGVKNYSEGFRNKEGNFYTTDFIIEEMESTGLDMFEDELSHCVKSDGTSKPVKIVLTISHTDHDTQNNDYSNLKALCQKCHLNHDKEHHAKNARETREKKKGLIKLEL
jgi:hypothetical protein